MRNQMYLSLGDLNLLYHSPLTTTTPNGSRHYFGLLLGDTRGNGVTLEQIQSTLRNKPLS